MAVEGSGKDIVEPILPGSRAFCLQLHRLLNNYNHLCMPTTLRSYAKINLGLAIGPNRADGFHALTTLYQTVAAHDRVTVAVKPGSAGAARITLTCSDPRVPSTATGEAERNTAYRVVARALALLGISAEVAIHIEKRLPVQGGLGAGSANAAAALLGLEQELARHAAWSAKRLTGAQKLALAAEIGSDVPLFLIGGSVLGVGRGEQVYPMVDLPATPCVLALPEVGVSTPEAFRDWDALLAAGKVGKAGSMGAMGSMRYAMDSTGAMGAELTRVEGSDRLYELSCALASALCEPYSSGVLPLRQNLAKDSVLALVRAGIANDFEQVVFGKHPSLGSIQRTLAESPVPEQSALYAALSGSGSALFGLYSTEEAAVAAEHRLAEQGIRSLRTQTLPREPYWSSMVVESR